MNLIKIKKIVLATGITLGGGSVVFAATAGLNATAFNPAKADTYTLTLNADNAPAQLTNDYQNSFDSYITTTSGFDIATTFVLAKAKSGSYVELASRGIIYNTEAVHGLTGITVSGTGSLSIKTAYSDFTSAGAYYSDAKPMILGSKFALDGVNFFQLIAGDNGAVINSVTLEFTCEEPDLTISQLYGTWTGQDGNGNRYKLDLGSSCQLQSLKKIPALSLNNGTASLNSTALTVAFSDLTLNLTVASDNQSLTFASSTGNKASEFTNVNFNRVYKVEDFESYSAAGQGWSSANGASSQYTASGARAHYYADYYGTQPVASPIGGSGWSMMGSADYMQYTATGGRNGSKAIAFKGNSANCRYFQMNAFYGVKEIIGKGAYMSFWAKGSYSNADLSTQNAAEDVKVKLIAYYNSKVTSSNQGAGTQQEFTIPAYTGWAEYKMQLDPSKEYYSFRLTCSKGGAYTLIDDVAIYTVSPYDTAELPSDAYYVRTTISSGFVSKEASIVLGFSSTGQAGVQVAGTKIMCDSVLFDEVTGNFEIDFGDKEIQYSPTITFTMGKITGTYNKQQNKLTNVNGSGSVKQYVSSNLTMGLRESDSYHNFNDTTANLQAKYTRRYRSGNNWIVDTGNANRIIANGVESVGGNSAKLKAYTSDGTAICLTNDKAITASTIGFWAYNPNSTNAVVRAWVYRSQGFEGDNEIINGGFTIPAGQWMFCVVGFNSGTIYNFQLATFSKLPLPLSFDNVMFTA